MIDHYVGKLIIENNCHEVENLILNNYEELLLATVDPKNHQSPVRAAELAGHQEIVELLNTVNEYRADMRQFLKYVRLGDEGGFTRQLAERKLIFGQFAIHVSRQMFVAVDERGRTALHLAVLCGHMQLALKIAEAAPSLVITLDCHDRTPLHMLQWLPGHFLPGFHTSQILELAFTSIDLKSGVDAFGHSVADYTTLKKTGRVLNSLLFLETERNSLPREDTLIRQQGNALEARKEQILLTKRRKEISFCVNSAPALAFPVPGFLYRSQRSLHT
ncbi:hypothetical protein Ciccas_005195 [Cichlidogyrus casuarinus]|uniref:Uncharacterized protein n=1 Tax=Cichlidogyrus casuarinus TaxID=1844966 RepID=A0ABD2QA99_9PLAT